MTLLPDLIRLLVCPECHGELIWDEGNQTLSCETCRLRFRVVDDVPVMLIDEAERY